MSDLLYQRIIQLEEQVRNLEALIETLEKELNALKTDYAKLKREWENCCERSSSTFELYKELQSKNEKLEEELESKEKHIRICHDKIMDRCTLTVKEAVKLEEENAQLREALSFYADFKNWNETRDYRESEVIKGSDLEVVGLDTIGGKLARLTLAKLTKENI